jgi:predicted ATPase
MIHRLAVSGYRSLRNVVIDLGAITVITGANGSGKSSLYRALRLLADVAQGRIIASLAAEGGLPSTLWAGPEQFSRDVKAGIYPVQGTRRSAPVSLQLGFASDDYGYAIDLGLPAPSSSRFTEDPEIKAEAVWTGAVLRPSSLLAERRGPAARVRSSDTGTWLDFRAGLADVDSIMTHCADATDGVELMLLRERMRRWRFYDDLRTDRDAPARRPQIGTYTPVLASDGGDIGAAVQTIFEVGDGGAFAETIADAFDGAAISVGARFEIEMKQYGLLRALSAPELSDGTMRYILLAAALLSPRPPELMILNEPESSLHPDLLAPLARLMTKASERSQIVVVSHSAPLVGALERHAECHAIALRKELGETIAEPVADGKWEWPRR